MFEREKSFAYNIETAKTLYILMDFITSVLNTYSIFE